MKKRKMIIEITEEVGDYEALEALLSVISIGKISKGAKGKDHYCWLTIDHRNIAVSTKPKYGTNNDRFVIFEQKIKTK